jgi:hypothetical protein
MKPTRKLWALPMREVTTLRVHVHEAESEQGADPAYAAIAAAQNGIVRDRHPICSHAAIRHVLDQLRGA